MCVFLILVEGIQLSEIMGDCEGFTAGIPTFHRKRSLFFFLYHRAEGSVHLPRDERLANEASQCNSSAEGDTINVYIPPCH